jgi:anti-sigma factor RsiW
MTGGGQDQMTCREVVELVTDYLEGRLHEPERGLFEAHLSECSHCDEYLAQMRRTIELLGELPVESIDPARELELLAAFRGWRNQ